MTYEPRRARRLPTPRTRRARLACALAAALLAGCGGGGASTDTAGGTQGLDAELKFLGNYMRDWYLWYARVPATDVSGAASLQAALDALRVPEDRYSFIESAQTYYAFFDEGRALGFGIAYAIGTDSLPVRYVQPLGNAAAAGMRRGDRVIAIGGVPVATLVAQGALDGAFGPDQDGWSTTFTVQRGAQTLELPMSKSWYAVRAVLDARVIANGDRRVGYIDFLSFTEPASAEWTAALAQVLQDGAQDLVVDLRENGGGRLSVAGTLASSMATPAASGQPWLTIAFNDRHADANEQLKLAPSDTSARIERVVWITGPGTCSASEALIEGLAPLRGKTLVGETTCGKPVGFTPPQFGDKVYNLVSFRLSNSAGETDWYTGLAPTCAVAETFAGTLGDPSEAKLAAALAWLRDGRCPAAGKSLEAPVAAWPRLRGLASQTGLK